jgi:hypothetical protein
MSAKRIQPSFAAPDLPPEKAFAALKGQLDALQHLNGQNYQQARAEEQEWRQFTEKLIIRSFGEQSPNHQNFRRTISAGQHSIVPYGGGIPHQQNQRNFEARIRESEAVLNACLKELELDLPSAYEPGEQYEFYRDVKACLALAKKEIFVIDPYLSTEIFDVYATAIPRSVSFRLLSGKVPPDVEQLAKKYAAGGNLEFRSSASIHDRVIFADNRVWLIGQSLKDAAAKKPTYIVEHDESLQRPIYEAIWNAAKPII